MERLPRLLGGVIFAVLAISTHAQLGPVEPRPVDSLCAVALCIQGTTCRVVQECAGPVCQPQVACLPCVPEGVDDVCNRNRYYYAVLVGDANKPSELTERKCDPSQPNGEPNCPDGSVCVDDGSGRGTCCYGKPDPPPEVGTVISNNEPICPVDKCGGCEPGYVCSRVYVQCAKYPCDPQYQCVKEIKDGYCPILPAYVPDWCPERRWHRCEADHECPGTLKCCSNQCGQRRCTRPTD